MSLNGEWVTANDTERSSELWAWGEWEAESTARELSRPGGDPRLSPYLWTPHYVSQPSYAGLHNTDPFIFGKRFLCSNCGQPRGGNSGLRHLGRGSVIIFGSQFKKRRASDGRPCYRDRSDRGGAAACEEAIVPNSGVSARRHEEPDGGGRGTETSTRGDGCGSISGVSREFRYSQQPEVGEREEARRRPR